MKYTQAGPEYDHVRKRSWEKTGCLLTADGSEDAAVTPEGLENFVVPGPMTMLDPSPQPPPPCVPAPGATSTDIEEQATEDDADEDNADEHPSNDVDERLVDDLSDRVFTMAGKRIRCLYENGWFTGSVEYFNSKLNEYKVSYEDGTTDYIDPGSVDGVECYWM